MPNEYCPKCLIGHKTVRRGKYSDFMGCNRFPNCDYMEKIKQEDKDILEQQADEILKQNGKAELII